MRGDFGSAAAPSVTVVIPALNESENIEWVLDRIPEWVDEVIVVDGGSTDGTVEKVLAHLGGAAVIGQPGTGKGDALRCGFDAATGDIIVMLDADGSTDPAEIPRFVAALRTGADFAKGTRYVTGGGSSDITTTRSWGNKTLTILVNRCWREANFSDLCYGYNAFWRRFLPTLHVDATGFEVETLLSVRALRNRLRVIEVPSFENSRLTGASKLRSFRDGSRALRTIVAERLRP